MMTTMTTIMAGLGMFAPAAHPSTTSSVALWLGAAIMAGLVVMRRKKRKAR